MNTNAVKNVRRGFTVVNYGGGTNSTALLVEAFNRGLKVDLIVFADTGSEHPETYSYLDIFDTWLSRHGMPTISRVKWVRVRGELAGKFLPLHEWCESQESVPSRAYGFSGCTSKWKQQPADKFIRNHVRVKPFHLSGEQVDRWIGFDADEPERAERMMAKNPEPHLWRWMAPLVQWDMGRDECRQAISKEGLPLPGKSACWMCPSLKKREILSLREKHPDLLDRALRMESRAIRAGNLGVNLRKGLGGRLNWANFLREHDLGQDLSPDANIDDACGCYDGGDE